MPVASWEPPSCTVRGASSRWWPLPPETVAHQITMSRRERREHPDDDGPQKAPDRTARADEQLAGRRLIGDRRVTGARVDPDDHQDRSRDGDPAQDVEDQGEGPKRGSS